MKKFVLLTLLFWSLLHSALAVNIDGLPAASGVNSTDLYECEQGGVNNKCTITQLSSTYQVESNNYGCASVVNSPSSDAGPCIQATINAATNLDRVAHFSGGVYYVMSPVSFPSKGVYAKGDGWNITYAPYGTWFHVVSSNFMGGGTYAGTPPFSIINSNNNTIDNIAFTEDQPADTGGWTPNNYGPMISVNNTYLPVFKNLYAGGVNEFIDIVHTDGLWVENITGQFHTYGFLIQANADYAHISHIHVNDFACSVTNCPNVTAYDIANSVTFETRRNDSPSFVDVQIYGVFTGMLFSTQSTGVDTGVTTKAEITNYDCDGCYYAFNVTGDAVTFQATNVHSDNLGLAPTNPELLGSNLLLASGSGDIIDLANVRSTHAGDSAISLTGTGSELRISNFKAEHWGSSAVGGALCNTIYALNQGTGNTVLANHMTFAAGCSPLTYVSAIGIDNGDQLNWTPSLNFGGATTGITTSVANGSYLAAYGIINMQLAITLTSVGSATGTATIKGVPIPTNNSGTWGHANGGTCTSMSNMSGLSAAPIIAQLDAASTSINLLQMTSTGTAPITNSNFTNTTTLYCNLSYFQ